MNDPIDRQAAMNAFAEYVKRSNNSDFAPTPTWNNAVDIVENLPSVDAVEVVRCWNCVWWDDCPSSTITPNFHKCKRVGRMSMPSDGFCSYGERKKENKK